MRKMILLLISLFFCTQVNASPLTLTDLDHLNANIAPVPHGQLEYYEFGDGQPIVLISGYATGVASWNREFLLALAKQYKVIIFNNRDIGQSIIHSTTYTTIALAEDTYRLITKLKLNKPYVIGISMGGMIAQQLAIRHAEDLGGLILINTAIAGHEAIPPKANVQDFILHTPNNLLIRYVDAVRYIAPPHWRLYMAYKLYQDHFIPHGANETLRTSPTILAMQQQLILGWSKNTTAALQLRHLQLPTLILNGGADEVIPPINSDILKANIPHAQLVRFKEGGHVMMYQFPVQIAQAIDKFIAQKKLA